MTAGIRRGGADRGQTGIDFAIGIGVFLITIAFVFSFMPTMFEPFADDVGTNMMTADRSAAHLAEGALVEDPSEPALLNTTCTVEFFETDGSVPDGCRFTQDASDLRAAVGVGPTTILNVTIENDTEIQTVNGQRLAAGSIPSGGTDIIVARRVVLLDGEQYTIFVRVW